ncbi:MAG: hypothetical protein J7J17_03270 [Hadesarchaea archaeon]|nr:hypothetical protein [Hadesarchaea archaeon]
MPEAVRTTVRFEAILFLAGLFITIGTLGPWEVIPPVERNPLSSWHGNVAFVGGIITMVGALISYEFFRTRSIESRRPLMDAGLGALGAVLGIVSSVTFLLDLSPGASPGWALYLTLAFSLIALFAAYGLYRDESPRIPKGLSATHLVPVEKSQR